jgi:hypothetical protein
MVTNNKSTNGMAIAGFVCSFFVQILGLIFSIVGLSQIKKTGESGRGLAIAGIVISAIGIFLTILAVIAAVVFSAWIIEKAVNSNPGWDCGYGHQHGYGFSRVINDFCSRIE